METEWLLDEIVTGLQKLFCLSLDRTPAAEMLPGTAQVWLEAITDGKAWDEARDAERIRSGFVTLARTVRRWPAPVEFIEAVPRFEQAAIGYEVKPATPEQAAEALRKIRSMLNEPMPIHNAAQAKREGPPLAEVETELSAHYGDRKSAAAGES